MAYKLDNTSQVIQSLTDKIKTADELIYQLKENVNQLLTTDREHQKTKQILDDLMVKYQVIFDEMKNFFSHQEKAFDNYTQEMKTKQLEFESSVNNAIQEINKNHMKHVEISEQKLMNHILQMQLDVNRRFDHILTQHDQMKSDFIKLISDLNQIMNKNHKVYLSLFAVLLLGIILSIVLNVVVR